MSPGSPWPRSGSRRGTRSTTGSCRSGCSSSSRRGRCPPAGCPGGGPGPGVPGRAAVPRGSPRRVAGDPAAAAVRIARALPPEAPGAGPQLLARVLFLRLLALTGFQHAADALATARDLLALPAAPAPLVAAARIMEVSAALILGRVEEARALGDKLSEAVARARSPVLDLQHAFVRSALLNLQGRLDEAEAVVAPYAPVGSLDTNHVLGSWTSQRCDRALQRGTLGDLVDELAVVRRRTGLDGYGAAQALGLLQLGRREEARAARRHHAGPDRTTTGGSAPPPCLLLAAVELARPRPGPLPCASSCRPTRAVSGSWGGAPASWARSPASPVRRRWPWASWTPPASSSPRRRAARPRGLALLVGAGARRAGPLRTTRAACPASRTEDGPGRTRRRDRRQVVARRSPGESPGTPITRWSHESTDQRKRTRDDHRDRRRQRRPGRSPIGRPDRLPDGTRRDAGRVRPARRRVPPRARRGARRAHRVSDRARARRVLHHHHTVEDELVWPMLLARVPERPHRPWPLSRPSTSGSTRSSSAPATSGSRSPSAPATLQELHEALNAHLDAEERDAVPLISGTSAGRSGSGSRSAPPRARPAAAAPRLRLARERRGRRAAARVPPPRPAARAGAVPPLLVAELPAPLRASLRRLRRAPTV